MRRAAGNTTVCVSCGSVQADPASIVLELAHPLTLGRAGTRAGCTGRLLRDPNAVARLVAQAESARLALAIQVAYTQRRAILRRSVLRALALQLTRVYRPGCRRALGMRFSVRLTPGAAFELFAREMLAAFLGQPGTSIGRRSTFGRTAPASARRKVLARHVNG